MADYTGLSTGWNPLPPGGAPGIGTSILGIPTQYLGDLGMGLLANSGPTKLPSSFGQRLGQAGSYANERRDQGILNDARRMEIQSSALENQGLAQMQQWMMANPELATDDTKVMEAYTKFMPGQALKARMGSYISPADRIQMQLNQAQLAKLFTEGKGKEGENVTTASSSLGNVKTVAEASKRLDDAGSVFQPGGFVESAGGLTAAASGLSVAKALGIGGAKTEELYHQVNDALTVSKATAALARGLQTAGNSSPRSNYALQNIQTALASGVPWPAKRTAMIQNLKDIFLDTETQGIQNKIPEYASYKELYNELVKQDTEWQAAGGGNNAVAQPPASTVITPQPGVPNRTPAAVPGPTPTPVQTVPVRPAEAGAVSAPAATLDQAVPAGTEDSKAVSNANGLALNAAGKPVFTRWVDAQRANEAGKLKSYDYVIVNGRIVDLK